MVTVLPSPSVVVSVVDALHPILYVLLFVPSVSVPRTQTFLPEAATLNVGNFSDCLGAAKISRTAPVVVKQSTDTSSWSKLLKSSEDVVVLASLA